MSTEDPEVNTKIVSVHGKPMTTASKESPVKSFGEWFKLSKDVVYIVGAVVTMTLVYSNMSNSIDSLREANRMRQQEILDVRTEMNNRASTQDQATKEIRQKLDDQSVSLAKISAQLDLLLPNRINRTPGNN